jgi:Glyoxalase superfamily protein
LGRQRPTAIDKARYAQISRAGLILHLNERHGDGSPSSNFIVMAGIEPYYRELSAKAKFGRQAGCEDCGARLRSASVAH